MENSEQFIRAASESDPGIRFIAYAPERGKRASVIAASGCCCTCSCCSCLHSVGGIIGAAVASRPVRRAINDERHAPALTADWSAASIYWLCLCVSVVAAFAAEMTLGASALLALFGLLVLMPGVQLAASLLAAMVAGLQPQAARGRLLLEIGRITSGSMLGALIGLALSLLLLSAFGWYFSGP